MEVRYVDSYGGRGALRPCQFNITQVYRPRERVKITLDIVVMMLNTE